MQLPTSERRDRTSSNLGEGRRCRREREPKLQHLLEFEVISSSLDGEEQKSLPIGRGTKGMKIRETFDSGKERAVRVRHE